MDVQEIFDLDPLEITRPQLAELVAHLRTMRKSFNNASVPAKDPKRAKPAGPLLDLDIEL